VLKGDLVTTPLPAVLRQLADGVVSGCLHVDDGVGGTAKVFLRGGQVYSVQVPGRRPQLGARLVSSGALGPEALAEALEAQRTELQGWRLGELLVHLGYVDQPIVESFVHEQLREQTSDLMRWPTGSWKFRVNERTREDVAPPTSVEELLESVEQRRAQWDVITEVLHGPDAVPMLSAAGQTDAEMSIDPESWSLLCKVDGLRSVSELARECGFTLFEAGQVVYSLVRSGLLEVEEVLVGAETAAAPAPSVDSVTSRLAMAFAPEIVIPAQAEEIDPADVANLVAKALREDRTLDTRTAASDEIDASVGRVSQALSALLGDDSSASDDLFAAPKRGRNKIPKPMTLAEEAREKRQEARAKAHAKRRAADADELAQAQAELEATRAAEAEADAATLAADHQAEIVNLAAARQAAEERAAAEAEAARLFAEEEARVAAEAEAAEAARVFAEEEARVAAEAAAAEEAERVRVEAELRAAAEAAEAARVFAEEEARVAAEQAAAEQAERVRVEAEQRAAAEAEAAEAEAARVFAEEEARVAAEAAAAEEAERVRVEAEQRAAAEAEAAAAEAEAARIAAEQEAARLFAEEEARVAAEAEAAAAAAEAARLFAEEEARVAAEEAERVRVETELREAAEKQAADEEAHQIAQAAEAARIAAEFEAAQAERLAAEAEEQARSSQQRLHTADAFAELSAAAATAGDTLIAPVETVVQIEEHVEDQLDEAPLRTYPPADTDMASLFRELSSLGHEDEPPAPTGPSRPAAKAAHPAAAKPKKKGLFGR
jgi:hypothetical protein